MNVGLPIAPVNTYYCIMRPSSSRNATRLLLPTNKHAMAAHNIIRAGESSLCFMRAVLIKIYVH